MPWNDAILLFRKYQNSQHQPPATWRQELCTMCSEMSQKTLTVIWAKPVTFNPNYKSDVFFKSDVTITPERLAIIIDISAMYKLARNLVQEESSSNSNRLLLRPPTSTHDGVWRSYFKLNLLCPSELNIHIAHTAQSHTNFHSCGISFESVCHN